MNCDKCDLSSQQMLTCQTCQLYFCNNHNLSGILKHLKDQQHNSYGFQENHCLKCQTCQSTNILKLYIDDKNNIFCSEHKNENCEQLVQGKKLIDKLFNSDVKKQILQSIAEIKAGGVQQMSQSQKKLVNPKLNQQTNDAPSQLKSPVKPPNKSVVNAVSADEISQLIENKTLPIEADKINTESEVLDAVKVDQLTQENRNEIDSKSIKNIQEQTKIDVNNTSKIHQEPAQSTEIPSQSTETDSKTPQIDRENTSEIIENSTSETPQNPLIQHKTDSKNLSKSIKTGSQQAENLQKPVETESKFPQNHTSLQADESIKKSSHQGLLETGSEHAETVQNPVKNSEIGSKFDENAPETAQILSTSDCEMVENLSKIAEIPENQVFKAVLKLSEEDKARLRGCVKERKIDEIRDILQVKIPKIDEQVPGSIPAETIIQQFEEFINEQMEYWKELKSAGVDDSSMKKLMRETVEAFCEVGVDSGVIEGLAELFLDGE